MAAHLTLPTPVEQRISGWLRIQERQARRRARPEPRPAVTISRQFGCEGFPLSLRLQDRFQRASGEPWHIFDKILIEKVAQDEELALKLLRDLEDPARHLEAFGFHPRGAVTAGEQFARMRAAVLRFATGGNAIIVGRGGAVLCRNLENCFHFRLEAELDWRVDALVRRMGIPRAEALELEHAESRLRERFIRDYLGAEVAERAHYDAVFNNARHSVDEIAAAIFAYVESGWPAR